MWDEDMMINYLEKNLKKKRFLHSLGVRDTAIKLSKVYEVDEGKANIAGLLHDCGKYMSDDKILKILKEDKIHIDEVTKENPSIMHGYASAYTAKNVMGVKDKEILEAITYHTTGRENMSKLEKIILLADYIEPLRDFKGVDDLRKLSYINLDKAMIKSFDNTIVHVINNGGLLHAKTVEARNYLLYNGGENDE